MPRIRYEIVPPREMPMPQISAVFRARVAKVTEDLDSDDVIVYLELLEEQ